MWGPGQGQGLSGLGRRKREHYAVCVAFGRGLHEWLPVWMDARGGGGLLSTSMGD